MKKEYRNEKGELHRTDGPALITDLGRNWYINGKLHREDGPALQYPGIERWWLNGVEYTEEEYQHELVKIKLKRLIEL